MLIDTREPEHDPPVWEPNLAVWWRGTLGAALGITAFFTADSLSLLAMLLAFYFTCSAVERALPYWGGLTEHRQ